LEELQDVAAPTAINYCLFRDNDACNGSIASPKPSCSLTSVVVMMAFGNLFAQISEWQRFEILDWYRG